MFFFFFFFFFDTFIINGTERCFLILKKLDLVESFNRLYNNTLSTTTALSYANISPFDVNISNIETTQRGSLIRYLLPTFM